MQTVSAQPGKPTRVALLLAAGIIAVLIGVVFSFSTSVRADGCKDLPSTGTTANPTPVHDVHEDLEEEICGGGEHDDSTIHAAISSTEPGAAVAIKLTATAEAVISGSDTITVDFKGPTADSDFILPVRIANPTATTSRVTIKKSDDSEIKPSIQLEGTKVILRVPSSESVPANTSYTITFKTTAGIKNPYYANPNYEASRVITIDDGDAESDLNAVVIRRRTTVTPPEGQRGDNVTLQGRGYAKGTVTIFDRDPAHGDAEILDAVETGTGTRSGQFSTRLSGLFRPGVLSYEVWTKDSEGVMDNVTFRITEHTTSFEQARVVAGGTLRIIIEDWQGRSKGVAAVRIAGEVAYVTGVVEYDACIDYTGRELANDDSVISLDVTVPESILSGQQTVSVYDYDQLELTPDVSMTMPCTDAQNRGMPTSMAVTARLKGGAIPIIQATVDIVSELPAEPTRGLNILEVDGGRDRELGLRVYPPDSGGVGGYLDADDQIEISLPEFDLSGAVFKSSGDKGVIQISESIIPPAQIAVDALGDKLVLTLPNSVSFARSTHEYIEITITKGTGILTPETPRGFDGDPDYDGYPVAITFVDKDAGQPDTRLPAPDNNIVVVKNPVSSTVPSATVRVELATHAEVTIGSSEEITVDFSGPSADSEFIIPTSIVRTRVTIRPEGESSFNPSDVLVQGARVILTIPSGISSKTVRAGDYTISFSQLARIRNPFSAGNRVITVSSSVEGDTPDDITAVIKRTTTIDPLEGPRGSTFELEGKGYAEGTVTVFDGPDDNIDPGETLASVNTARGVFRVNLTARGKPGDLRYTVRTKDSYGVLHSDDFMITGAMIFDPPSSGVGSRLRITVFDWEDDHEDVVAVRIAGQTAFIAGVTEYDNCIEHSGGYKAKNGVISLEVKLPKNVPQGEQTVSVYDHHELKYIDAEGKESDKEPCEDHEGNKGNVISGSTVEAEIKETASAVITETILIEREELTLTPNSAARGQRVTVTGSGFSRAARGRDHIYAVWIGGKRVADDHSEFEVGSAGDFAFTITVPLEVADGENEVLIEGVDDTIGQATLTIPEATITLEPTQGPRGAKLKVTGSGFIAKEVVLLSYGPEAGAASETASLAGAGVLADTQGNFELTFKVPVIAEVGKRYKVTAVARGNSRGAADTMDAEAEHLVVKATITTSPASVSPGDRLTVIGQGLPPFTLVGPIKIGGIAVMPGSEIATDKNGSFETDVLVPQIDFGDQTLLIQVAGTIVPRIINLAAPPLSGPPTQVFKYLIRDGVLSSVWHYDNATQDWSLFDPSLSGELAMLNDLTGVSSGDIVWVNLSKPEFFQGSNLAVGWNLISLK